MTMSTDNLQQKPQRTSARPPLKHWLWRIAALLVRLFFMSVGAGAMRLADRS